MTYYYSSPLLNLKMIPLGLMTQLLSSADLFVMQTEFSIYVMLKYWMYMVIHAPAEEPSTKDMNLYYCARKGNEKNKNKKPFRMFAMFFFVY